jgi:hypothetical protein
MSYPWGMNQLTLNRLSRTAGGVLIPSWVPRADGALAELYADFANQRYWFNDTQYADFAAWRTALSGTLDGSSTRYYTNSAGLLVGTTGPRFDYDPGTLLARGLLLEGTRTNILQRSQEFDNAYWTTSSNATIAANDTIAPDGTNTADRITEAATTATHRVAANGNAPFAVTASTTYTASIYRKKGTRQFAWIAVASATGQQVTQFFDLDGVALGTNSTDGSNVTRIDAKIVDVGAGWRRVTLTVTFGVGVTTAYFYSGLASADSTNNYAGSTSEYGWLWGAQFEAGAFASSYIPTTSGSVTRAADSLVFTPISGWFNANAGTVLFRGRAAAGSGANQHAWCFDDGTISEEILITRLSSSRLIRGAIDDGGATQVSSDTVGSVSDSTEFRHAMAWAANDFGMSLGGAAVVTDTSLTLPTVTKLLLGNRSDGARPWDGHIREFGYWPQRTSNGGIQALAA